MNNKKGISMISLVIVIVVTIILIAIVTTAGYRYITETNRVEAETLVNVIAEAAYRHQNDLTSGVEKYYEGYTFLKEGITSNEYKNNVEGIPPEDNDNDGIPDCLQEEGSKWFLFDAESSKALGVTESEKFLTRNISYPQALKEETVKLVLADYSSGNGYLITMPTNLLSGAINHNGGCPYGPGGQHRYSVATCTEPPICTYCGAVHPTETALGHDFSAPTCTSSGICRRCGIPDPDNGPLGHDFIKNSDINDTLRTELSKRECSVNKNGTSDDELAWILNALKHWHECKRCGEKSAESEHSKGMTNSATGHRETCSVCGWQSLEQPHKFIYESVDEDKNPSNNKHTKTCTVSGCGYSETHEDSGWQSDLLEYHYRTCPQGCSNSTVVKDGKQENVLFAELHYDNNNDSECDVCGRSIDYTPPYDFGTEPEYYARVIDTTTNSITIEAATKDKGGENDNYHVAYYEFGMYNSSTGKIDWRSSSEDRRVPASYGASVTYKFENLRINTEYSIYVRAVDKNNNINNPYRISGTKTKVFPDFSDLTGIPDDYVKGPLYLGIVPIETELPWESISVEYSLDEGTTWKKLPLSKINSSIESERPKIELTKEKEHIKIKLTDTSTPPNESPVHDYQIEKIDATAPTVKIDSVTGDNNEDVKQIHTAIVTISDSRSGILPNTEVKYAWSDNKDVAPSSGYTTVKTENTKTASSVSFDVTSPTGIKGKYYLWIQKGIKDRVGNETEKAVCSSIYFELDAEFAKVTDIEMVNNSPEVNYQKFFVKTNGYITITFKVTKELLRDPYVLVNGYRATDFSLSDDKLTYTYLMQITDHFEEGPLQLTISNVTSKAGVVDNTTYTNDDIKTGPVIYDRTSPLYEYISKK